VINKLAGFLNNRQIQLGVRLFRNASIYALGMFLTGAGGIILLPIYLSRLKPEDYGILGLVAIASGVLSPLLSLGLTASMERLYLEWPSNERPYYVAAVWITGMAFGLSLTLFLDVTGKYAFPLLVSQVPFDPYIRITLWTTYLQGSWAFPFSILRVTEKLHIFTVASVGSFLLGSCISIYLVVGREMGATGVLLANLINAGVWAVLWAAFMFSKEIRFPFGWRHLKEPLYFGLPLIPATMIESVGSVFDRFFLDKFVPLSAVGLYSLGKQLGSYLAQINKALKSSWIPLTYRLAAEQPESMPVLLPRLSVMYTAVMAWFALAMALLGSDLIDLSGSKRFVGAYPLIPFFALSYFVLASASGLGRGLDIAKDMRLSPLIPLVTLAVSFFSNLLFVRPWGLYGAMLAFFLTSLTSTGMGVYLAHRIYPRRFPFVQVSLIVAVGTLAFLIGSSFTIESIGLRVIAKGACLLGYMLALLGIAVWPMAQSGLTKLRDSATMQIRT
jgi:O-antigen/teichoic acid export membrane protein